MLVMIQAFRHSSAGGSIGVFCHQSSRVDLIHVQEPNFCGS